ncbi:MAG: hypothetical protein ACE5E1_02610 [Phycisphaerae bacterium]
MFGVVGCTGFDLLFGPLPAEETPATDLDLGIAIVQPAQQVTTAPGVATIIQWADIASVEGTIVRVTAQRRNNLDEDDADPIELIGNGSPGTGRDAMSDGANDIFEWDINGVRVGDYVIIATIEAPDGTLMTVSSRDPDRNTNGSITVTTSLPAPTLTFSAPGATDETVTTGNTFDITWTDNGTANAAAVVVLGLDTDTDHRSGNEIVLLNNQPLSENGNAGQFTFFFQDENGAAVPDGTYTVFAIVDDQANDPVIVEAAGRLVLNP